MESIISYFGTYTPAADGAAAVCFGEQARRAVPDHRGGARAAGGL